MFRFQSDVRRSHRVLPLGAQFFVHEMGIVVHPVLRGLFVNVSVQNRRPQFLIGNGLLLVAPETRQKAHDFRLFRVKERTEPPQGVLSGVACPRLGYSFPCAVRRMPYAEGHRAPLLKRRLAAFTAFLSSVGKFPAPSLSSLTAGFPAPFLPFAGGFRERCPSTPGLLP